MKAKAIAKAVPVSKIKEVVNIILQNFVQEEIGNRVTKNNMMALAIQINQAFDGQITLPPKGNSAKK